MENLPIDLGVLIAAAFAVVAIILYLREYNQRKKLQSEGDKFLQQIKEKGWETLNQSIKKSQAILGQAELAGVKVAAQTSFETSKLEEEYSRQLQAVLNQSQRAITASQNQLLQFMQDLQKRSGEFEQASQSSGQERINQLFERLETKLSDFLIQTEQKTTSSIELELKAARQLLDTYKSEQLKLIDENIMAMMEQTLSLVLAKKLSLKDQLDLIYEALEKAKIEKFIV
ncbi:TPA: hypothetical protein DD690_01140 [Candidatus Daviesbacteria bacterium]|uniref:Uncharacterized protein n=1 Tax=Candidatus Daviesbacteria bacterium GW2011_GWF2_38_6 TaxID=1618432 RepID=A0A0G0KQN8_9BACT|nr:MAG: hypothetical protein US80_C0007G0007 [Candidatus Daviesbacteria bacterium GW2011_GWA2_38_17]KKQ77790.1 MAG: hypothetical protein US99_C0034G0002 [Candidatus Daviesbacteria bacterium GW2011_GWF2_38_6]OGE27851.1 MAG: hypothetical protein A3D02_03760 [Candidatus Daviesbacteria bacterium RIFCSPHIGHO2_02_FULL_39_41]OGE45048.1 MAG: hypothetical protein A3E67_00840 [Candidatus Daviesbacteria bacterium RIFCSPHIGHO2_12_FULL_38_25]OGE67532.1 MAG: hypothetical protein A3H81_00785 [Candidatus Davie